MIEKFGRTCFTLALMMFITALILLVSGCSSTSIITEYDAEGKVIKKTETKESVVEQVIASTQNKTVIVFRESYFVGLRAQPSDSLFTLESAYYHQNTGVASILKDQQNINEIVGIVKAIKQTDSVSVSSTGINSNSSSTTTTEESK